MNEKKLDHLNYMKCTEEAQTHNRKCALFFVLSFPDQGHNLKKK